LSVSSFLNAFGVRALFLGSGEPIVDLKLKLYGLEVDSRFIRNDDFTNDQAPRRGYREISVVASDLENSGAGCHNRRATGEPDSHRQVGRRRTHCAVQV
jgi:hypothetical protein